MQSWLPNFREKLVRNRSARFFERLLLYIDSQRVKCAFLSGFLGCFGRKVVTVFSGAAARSCRASDEKESVDKAKLSEFALVITEALLVTESRT